MMQMISCLRRNRQRSCWGSEGQMTYNIHRILNLPETPIVSNSHLNSSTNKPISSISMVSNLNSNFPTTNNSSTGRSHSNTISSHSSKPSPTNLKVRLNKTTSPKTSMANIYPNNQTKRSRMTVRLLENSRWIQEHQWDLLIKTQSELKESIIH